MSSRRRSRAVIAGLLILGIGAAAWTVLRRPSLVSGEVPEGLKVFSAFELGPPMIDFSIPVIGPIVYPRPLKTGYSFDPDKMAGIIRIDKYDLTGSNALMSYRWTIAGESIDGTVSKLKPLECPLVYGTKPIPAELKIDGFPLMKLMLPPNGIPEPKAREHKIALTRGTLHCKPRRLLSPLLPIRYEVTFEGEGTRFLQFSNRSTMLAVNKGTKGHFWIDRDGPSNPFFTEFAPSPYRTKARVSAGTLVEGPVFGTSSNGSPPWNYRLSAVDRSFEVFLSVWDIDGRAVVYDSEVTVSAGVPPQPGMFSNDIVNVDSHWFGQSGAGVSVSDSAHSFRQGRLMPSLHEGQVIDVVYYQMSTFEHEPKRYKLPNSMRTVSH